MKCLKCKIKERYISPNNNETGYCNECNKIKCREWYKKNKEYYKNKVIERLKENNYSYEKNEKQKRIRYIKRRTRLLYPLKGHHCEFCGAKATEHHHNTHPIKIDKFNFVCHKCHMKKDLELNNPSRK